MGIKQVVWFVYLLVALVGCAASGFYFMVNVSEIPERLTKVHIKLSQPQVSPEGEEEKEEPHKTEAKEGVVKSLLSGIPTYEFFKSITIDLSAITPFLLLWFFGALSFNTIKYRRGLFRWESALEERIDTLPLSARYESTAIQLGFIGTLWGFLIIGHRMQGISPGQSVHALDIILKAFGTALLSTFTAVVIVYVLTPIVRGIWKWMFDVDEDDVDIETQLYKLTDKLQQTSKATETLQVQIESFGKEIKPLGEKIKPLEKKIESLGKKIVEVSPKQVIDLLREVVHHTKTTSEITDNLRQGHLNGLSGKVSSLETQIVTQGDRIVSAHDSIIGELKKIEKSDRDFHEQSMAQAKLTEDSLVKKLEGIQKGLAQIAEELTKQKEAKPKDINNLLDEIGKLVKHLSKGEQVEQAGNSIVNKLAALEQTLTQFFKDWKAQAKRTENTMTGTPAPLSNTGRTEIPNNTKEDTKPKTSFFSRLFK